MTKALQRPRVTIPVHGVATVGRERLEHWEIGMQVPLCRICPRHPGIERDGGEGGVATAVQPGDRLGSGHCKVEAS